MSENRDWLRGTRMQTPESSFLPQQNLMIKNVIHPGWVVSKNDMQVNYVTYHTLIRLYHLNPAECIVYDNTWHMDKQYIDSLNHYYPNYNGNYDKGGGND